MLKHKLLGLMTCGALALGVAGCDSDDGGDTAASASATSTATATDSDSDDSDGSDGSDGSTSSDSDESDSDESTSGSSTTDDTSAGECQPSDPCQTDNDCDMAAGETCTGCICLGGDSTDTAGAGDPSYPNPASGCPMGTIDGNMAADPGVNVCIPVCDPMAADIISACPQPATGMSPGACILVTEQMGEACADMMGPDAGTNCMDPTPEGAGRFCLGLPAGGSACVAAVGCLVSCAGGTACPDGMTCSGGACVYM